MTMNTKAWFNDAYVSVQGLSGTEYQLTTKTTSLSGLSRAIATASLAPYTTRTSAPLDRSFANEEFVAGTLIMSPKVVMIWPFRESSIAMSTSFAAQTQTGQPGPATSPIESGSRDRTP